MTNRYLKKIAESKEPYKKPGPFATAVQQGAAGILPDIVGGTIGAKLGSKFGTKGTAIGTMTGAGLGGLAASYGVLKHQQLKGQKK